jgi:hypothetical protein
MKNRVCDGFIGAISTKMRRECHFQCEQLGFDLDTPANPPTIATPSSPSRKIFRT